MIKEILQDIVTHTHSLGFLPTIKITGTATSTQLDSVAEDKSVVMTAKLHTPVSELEGVFGLPNLEKLSLLLKCPEYQDDAKIDIITQVRNNITVPTTLRFTNKIGDYANDFRFMTTEIINEKIKNISFKGATWNITFEPTISSITRLKYQSQFNSQDNLLQFSTDKNNLNCDFGDAASHAGNFVFHNLNGESLKYKWMWPVTQVSQILCLSGNKLMQLSDVGAMQIVVTSDIAEYKYIIPALSK